VSYLLILPFPALRAGVLASRRWGIKTNRRNGPLKRLSYLDGSTLLKNSEGEGF